MLRIIRMAFYFINKDIMIKKKIQQQLLDQNWNMHKKRRVKIGEKNSE